MKMCRSCNVEKSLDLFSKCAKHGDGLSYMCKPCAKEYNKAYRAKNKDKLKESRREYEKGKRQENYVPKREQNKIDAEKHKKYCQENMHLLSKQCNKCLLEKKLSEFDFAHKEKDGFQYTCKKCNRSLGKEYRQNNVDKEKERHKKYALENPQKILERQRRWRENNKEQERERSREFYERNKEKENLRHKKWREENKDWCKNYAKKYRENNFEHFQKYDSEYFKNNKSKVYFKNAKRRALINNAYVSWANEDKIKSIYEECQRLTNETGIIHHVDHIIPLNHKLVCGLHNEFNLQILTAKENLIKNNKFDPKMFEVEHLD